MRGARVVRDLHRTLGKDHADLLAPDGFTPVPLLVERAGPAARDVFVTPGGLVTERLPAAGARFADRFSHTQSGAPVEAGAVYAAQSALVLLDAIARSDGTRRSVVDQMFRTRVTDGLLGTFRFDPHGDVTEGPVTVLRVREGGTSRTTLSVEGATVESVLRPPSSLVGTAG